MVGPEEMLEESGWWLGYEAPEPEALGRELRTTVSGISFVSMRGAWQKNSFFLIGYFKRLWRIVGRVAVLSLSIIRVGRGVLTKLICLVP